MTSAGTRGGDSKVQSVLAALDLLDCFAEDDELGVTQIARRLGVAKSTAHRLLSTLCARGIAERIPGTSRYRLGLHLYELGQLAQDRVPMRHIALPLLEELRLATRQTVHLSVAAGPDVVFIERLQTLGGIPLLGERHRRMPLHTTSSGKVLAAFDPEVAAAREAAGFPAMTPTTIRTAPEWRRALDAVRRTGVAVSDGENRTGLASIAAPVRDATGRAPAAVSVAGPSAAVLSDVDRSSRVVVLTANKLARRLGW
jgi:DNA-binding IclR family transcriptional regulator